MKIEILLYDKLTVLDAIGPYEVLRCVPEWEVRFVAKSAGSVRADSGFLALEADHALDPAREPEMVLVPGGDGSEAAMVDEEILAWLRQVDETTRLTTSVCTGSLVLAAAGLLEGRRATSHWFYRERLREFGVEPVAERWVEDGKFLTAAGVSAGIDMALHLVGRETAPAVAEAVQLGLEYDPQPPFDSGSPEKASEQTVELVSAVSRAAVDGAATSA